MTLPDSTHLKAALEQPAARPARSGVRSGAILTAASAVAIGANYVFLLTAGRILGAADYGALSALLGLLALVLLPAGALQMAVSREISRRLAQGLHDEADAFARATLRLALLATPALVVVALALAAPLAHLLHIKSTGVVALALTTFSTALVYPVAIGILQGSQRFHALGAMYVLPWVLRLGILGVLASAGYRLVGAVLATVAGAVAAMVLAVFLVYEPVHRAAGRERPALRSFLRYLGPVTVGLLGITLLTHVDILVVKARFASDVAGAYGAASAFARVALFLPATILTVLFPRTAARQARGEETKDILGRSLLATAGFCGALALFYAAAGRGLVVATFGAAFALGGEVLAPFALAVGLYSLANILVGYHLSRGETRYAWIVAGGVVVQVTVLALVPSGIHGVVWANVGVAGTLIGAHELAVGSSAPAIRAGLRHARGAAAALRAVAPETLLVLLGATVFVCALFWPTVVHLGSTIIGTLGSDSTGTVNGLWQQRHETGFHLLGLTHHTLTGAPFGWNESNALNLQVFLPYYTTYLVAHVIGDVAAYNLTLLAGYVLTGVSMYLLARYLGCARLVSAWAALVIIIFPWHLARAEHASLVHIEPFALLVLALVAAARRPSWPRFALVGAATLVCWLTSGYFGPMAVVTVAAFAIGAALVSSRGRRLLLVLGTTSCALAATGVVGLATVASGTNAGAGLKRAAGDLSIFGLRPVELVVPPRTSTLFGDRLTSFWVAHDHGSNQTEVTNYLGLLTIAFALTWLVLALRRRAVLGERQRLATAGLVTTFAAGLLFASPSPILVFGHKIWMPSRLLWEVVPALRVTSRWDPLLMTALVPLAALGLQAGWTRLAPPGRRIPVLASVLVGAAMIVSYLELSIKPVSHFRTVPVPPEYVALDRTPRGILAEYPLGYSDIFGFWQRYHGRPLLNGSPPGTVGDEERLMLLDPAVPGTARTLALLGVTAIGIHPGAHVDSEVLPREPVGVAGYRLVGRFSDGASFWRVTAPPAAALATLHGAFAIPRRRQDGFVGYSLVSPAGVGALELRSKQPGVVRVFFDAEPPAGSQRLLRVADAKGERDFTLDGRTHVSVIVEVPRGLSVLLIKAKPPSTSEDHAVALSAPYAESSSGEPVLHAELLSPDPGF